MLGVLASCSEDHPSQNNSATIATVKINTAGNTIVNEPKVPATFSLFKDGEVSVSAPIGIEYRGKFSYIVFPKKSYGIELKDESGEEASLPLLGMPASDDWILYASYNDKTFCRNVLIYDLSNRMQRYAARSAFVELELNGDYDGLYVLMEKPERGADKINITKMLASDIAGEAVTGGYILKIDKTDGEDWADHMIYTEAISFRSGYGVYNNVLAYEPFGTKQGEETYFLYDNPKAYEISAEQRDYIKSYVDAFETALSTETFEGTSRNYLNYIDLDSFVDYFILNELGANPDAYRLSTYLTKDRNGKLKMGPVWDFDFGFGNDDRSTTERWIYQYNTNYPLDGWLVPFWWPQLMSDPLFRQAVKERWNELINDELSIVNIEAMVDGYATELINSGVIERNFSRWDVLDGSPAENEMVEAYNDEIDELKAWIESRHAWMDVQIQDF